MKVLGINSMLRLHKELAEEGTITWIMYMDLVKQTDGIPSDKRGDYEIDSKHGL